MAAAGAVVAVGDGGEAADDYCNAAVAVADNADNVAQLLHPCDRFFLRVPAERSFCHRHQFAAGSVFVIVAAAAVLPAGDNAAVGLILDDSAGFR